MVKTFVSPEMKDDLDRLCRKNDRTLAAEVRQALRVHLGASDKSSPIERMLAQDRGVATREPAASRSASDEAAVPPDPPPVVSPAPRTASDVAAKIPGVQAGVQDLAAVKSERRITAGAAKGYCVHRVKLEAYCGKCVNGEAA